MSGLRYLLVLLVSGALATQLHRVEIGSVVPDLMLIVALYPSLRYGFREGYLFAYGAGLMVDLSEPRHRTAALPALPARRGLCVGGPIRGRLPRPAAAQALTVGSPLWPSTTWASSRC